MYKPLISIIVPIYKVEDFLDKCVNSILNQSYKNIEVILVDDGSPDSCGSICDNWAKSDNRVTVIHKKNGGLSDARNVAIDIMKGDYVTFIDSDDYVLPDYLEKLYNALNSTSSDIAICNFSFNYQNRNEIVPAFDTNYPVKVQEMKEGLKDLLYQNHMETSAWGKLYRSKLFDGIRYPVGRLFEDISTTYKTFLKSDRIVNISDPLYVYLIRDSSIMGQSFTPRKMDAVYMAKDMLEGILKYNDEGLIKAAYCRYISMCFNTLFQTNSCSKEERYILDEIARYRLIVLKDKKARLKTRIALSMSFFGPRILRTIYSFIH